jgi:hypothetical protein
MQGIHTHIAETNHVPAILSLLFIVPLFLVPTLAILFFYVSTFRSMCALLLLLLLLLYIVLICLQRNAEIISKFRVLTACFLRKPLDINSLNFSRRSKDQGIVFPHYAVAGKW